ncbi:MAG: ABC transporter permease subunit [Candidatus Hodarchaeota archaeon]
MQTRSATYKPSITNYFKFLGDLITGNWGNSFSIAPDVEIHYLIKDRAPITIDLLILPIMSGIGNYIVFGIILGRASNKYEGRRKAKAIQIFYGFSIAIPIFLFGMLLQYFFSIKLDWFPATGYKEPGYKDPKFITGFYIIDAFLAGETKKIFDYLYHMALPLFVLTIVSIALIAYQTHLYLKDKSHKKSIISNTAITGTIFSFIFMFSILIEITFGLNGIGRLFIDAINQYDYLVINVVLFIMLIMFVIITLISNLIFSLYKFLIYQFRFDSTLNDKAKKETEDDEIKSVEIITENLSIKKHLLNKVKSPLFIVSAILVVFFIVIAIFPQVITPYSFKDVTAYLNGRWDPPSPDHPLGTASFGRDVLGLTIWGIRDALVFGFGAVVIGLIGGSIFGVLSWISFFVRSRVKHSVALMIYYSLIYSAIIGFVITLFTFLIFGFTAIRIGLIGGPLVGFIVGILFFIISRVKRSDEQKVIYTLAHSVILGSMITLFIFLIFGFTDFLIGLIGGLIFGIIIGISYFIISCVKCSDEQMDYYTLIHSVTMGSLIIFSIFPGVILLIISIFIHGNDYWLVMSIIGIFLTPIFTRAIPNVSSREFSINKIGKAIISYIPLGFAIAIILYEVIGYLGRAPIEIGVINLGGQISIARWRLHTLPLASFSPGIAITCIVISFLLLHIALQDNEPEISKRFPNP